jgi:sensor histidine kinase YesM
MRFNKTEFLKELAYGQLIAVIIALVLYLNAERNFWGYLVTSFIMTNCIGLLIYLFRIVLEKKIQFSQKPRLKKIIYLTFIILSGTVLGVFIGLSIVSLVFGFKYSAVLKTTFPWLFLFCTLAAVIINTLSVLYDSLKEKIEKKVLENEELKRLQMRTQLIALQSKINPHFLFNTLNTMLNLVHKSPRKVETMILNLSDIYRRVLQVPENERILLKQEIDLVREYLEIEKIRLDERLSYSIKINPGLENFRIPPLLIEPIVENAVIHGISPKSTGGFIQIEIEKKETKNENEAFIVIKVEDNGMGIETQQGKVSKGFGLYSVQERIRLIYKDKAGFHIFPGTGEGTCVKLELPCED